MKSSTYFRQWAVFFIIQFAFIVANAQTNTPRYTATGPNSGGYYEYLPEGYNSGNQTYPLLVFLHGIGEVGDGSPGNLPLVMANGTPKLIRDGKFPTSFTVNGQTFKFIVISPQFSNWPSYHDVEMVLDYAVKNYRVNTSRVYLTGLSMGGGAVWDYAGTSTDYANRLAAIVPVCGASDPIPYRANVLATTKLPIWALHNLLDPTVPVSNTISYVDQILSLNGSLSSIVKRTIFPIAGHDAWTTSYDPNYRENGLNIYEWMLQFTRGGASAPPPPVTQNQSPVANAGQDQTITLPTNSVSLSGAGADADGNITGYSWSQVSGSSQYNINSSNIPNPTISNMAQGDYTFRLTVTDNGGASAYDDINIKVSGTVVAIPPPVNVPSNPGSDAVANIPGRIETENYNNMSGVQNEKTTDDGGGLDVGWIENGDWMDYKVNVATTGNYTVNFRVASPYAGLQLQLKSSDGSILTTANVPQTGDFQKWQTVSATVRLNAGAQTLRIYSNQTGWLNINWVEFIAVQSASAVLQIPGKIEAENYSSMSGVASESTVDNNGGMDVGWIENGDWIDYNVNVASSGTYTVNFRVATPYTGQQLQLKASDGSVLTTVNIPQTGAFQYWSTVSASVNLQAGNQTIRVYSSQTGWWNINWMEFVGGSAVASSGYTPIPGRIEAENYSAQSGVIAETTTDNNGGQDVGWIELGDWIDYKIYVPNAGNYNINFRIAAPISGNQLQVKTSSGNVLTTLNIPQTDGFQQWNTITAPVYLQSGNQTIRIYSSQIGWWNINWLEFVAGSLSATPDPVTEANISSSSAIASAGDINKEVFSIYPNPVKSMFELKITNKYTGAMNVQVVNEAGAIVKQFKLSKDLPVSQLNLSASGLPPGTYFIKVQIGKWSDSKKLLKL